MTVTPLMLDACRLWTGEQPSGQALAFVDLDETREWPESPHLPPCPVIGLGSREHPLADALDAVIEPPVTAEILAAQVLANPHAASVSVQLLRLIDGLSEYQALVAESLAYGLLQGSREHLTWRESREIPIITSPQGRVEIDREAADMTITLDRPEADNAIDQTMRDALHEAFAAAALDLSIERLLLKSRGRRFSLGADLAEFGTTLDPATAHAIRQASLPAAPISACANRLEVQVQGACVGAGLEMAAWGRRIVASHDAWFQLPELAMGVLPGAGGCVSLSRRIGRQRTALMLLSGKRISARTALGWGLIDAIADDLALDQGQADIS